jgi:hypothetical protein
LREWEEPSRRCRHGTQFYNRAAIHRRDLWSPLKCAAGTHRQLGSARLTRDSLSSFLPFSSLGRTVTVTVPVHGLLAPAQSSAPSAHSGWFHAGACVCRGGLAPPACSSSRLGRRTSIGILMHKSDVRLRDCPAGGVGNFLNTLPNGVPRL